MSVVHKNAEQRKPEKYEQKIIRLFFLLKSSSNIEYIGVYVVSEKMRARMSQCAFHAVQRFITPSTNFFFSL